MCFPYYHSCLRKKNDLGYWNFYVFSFGNWANVIRVIKWHSQFPWENKIIFYSVSVIVHLLFPFLFVSCIYSFYRLSICQSLSFFTCQVPSICSPSSSSGFSPPSPFQTYSSQYLPVLSKCYCKVFQWDDSKYVYINRGNTLGYILLTLCHVFFILSSGPDFC